MRVAQNDSPRDTEQPLRKIIAELQRGAPDVASMEPALLSAVQAQAAPIAAMLGNLGVLQRIQFTGVDSGADTYRVTFEKGEANWFIRLSPTGKIAALFFKPVPSVETAGEEVEVKGLSGTLLKPSGVTRPPVVLLVAGSGPTDRNGNQGGSGPGQLRQLAQELAEGGIASLRYDKRGIGRSSMGGLMEQDLVLDSFVDDAASWLDWLQRRDDLGPRTVAGHSEGGMIALRLAKRLPLTGMVLIATPGRKVGDGLRDQLKRIGLSPELLVQALTVLAALERGESVAVVDPALLPLFRPSVQPFMRSVLAIDPGRELHELTTPALIVSGGHDLQATPEDAAALAAARPDAARLDLPEMNHDLKIAPADAAGQQAIHSDPARPLAPGLSRAVADFVHSVSPR